MPHQKEGGWFFRIFANSEKMYDYALLATDALIWANILAELIRSDKVIK